MLINLAYVLVARGWLALAAVTGHQRRQHFVEQMTDRSDAGPPRRDRPPA